MAKTLLLGYLMIQFIPFPRLLAHMVTDHLGDAWPRSVSGRGPHCQEWCLSR